MLISDKQSTKGVYSTDQENGTLLLTINQPCHTFIGSYTCTDTNTHATLVGITTVYGLPPPIVPTVM